MLKTMDSFISKFYIVFSLGLIILEERCIGEMHFNCRNKAYPFNPDIKRTFVPDDKVWWNVTWEDYRPPIYSSNRGYRKYQDAEEITPKRIPVFNAIDGTIDRRSLLGNYSVINNYPINPIGRTGLRGRGMLDRWGPNLYVNLVITRWKYDKYGLPVFNRQTRLPVFQILALRSKGRDNWSAPGNNINPGERFSDTIKRVYWNGILNYRSIRLSHDEMEHIKNDTFRFFEGGEIIYRGYVDDTRNTDNAWVECIAKQYHADKDDWVFRLPVRYTQNTLVSKWVDEDSRITWIARHRKIMANMKPPPNAPKNELRRPTNMPSIIV